MKSGIKNFILKIEHSTNTLLVHSLIILFRLLIFFRYLASGNTFVDLHYSYRLGDKTIGNCVRRVCNALWDQMVEEQLPFPTQESWQAIIEGFKNTAHFPNCIGSVDGKRASFEMPWEQFNELELHTFFFCSSYGRGRFKLSLCIHICRSIQQGP